MGISDFLKEQFSKIDLFCEIKEGHIVFRQIVYRRFKYKVCNMNTHTNGVC